MGERELRVPEDTSLRAAREVSGLRCPTVLVCKAVRVWCVWRALARPQRSTHRPPGRTRDGLFISRNFYTTVCCIYM